MPFINPLNKTMWMKIHGMNSTRINEMVFICLLVVSCLFLSNGNLGFLCSTYFLGSVLSFLSLFTSNVFSCEKSRTNKTIFGLILLDKLHVVVDQTETSCLATSKMCSKSIKLDCLWIGYFVHFGDFLFQFSLWNICSSMVNNIKNHLLTR